mgnify:CR=1 FL=1
MIYIVDDDEIIFSGSANEIPGYYDDYVALFLKHFRYFKIFLLILIQTEIISDVIVLLHSKTTIDEVSNSSEIDP